MKVLVLGDSLGDLQRTLEKAALLLSKQSFDCLLCLGDLLPPTCSQEAIDALVHSSFPLPCYFMDGAGGVHASVLSLAREQDGQVAPNLFYLGGTGSLHLSTGLEIGFYSSLHTKALSGNEALRRAQKLDILMVDALPPLAAEERLPAHDVLVDLLTTTLPKYAFACAKEYEERKPYRSNGRLVREIALASVANTAKAKWFYAVNVTNDAPRSELMASASACPYVRPSEAPVAAGDRSSEVQPAEHLEAKGQKRKRPPTGYCCKLCSEADDHYYKDCPNREQQKKQRQVRQTQVVRPDTCFFCLSNPNLARHLLVSIGDHGSYMALPKGAMTPNHVLIIPVSHAPTMKLLEEARAEVESEMTSYVTALDQYYATLGSVACVFELARSRGVHCHWQVIPISFEKCDEMMEAFRTQAQADDHPMQDGEPDAGLDDYFRVAIPRRNLTMHTPMEADSRFDLQFGRRIVANVMGVPKRAHWKDCIRTDEQEASDAAAFKKAFKSFDPSL